MPHLPRYKTAFFCYQYFEHRCTAPFIYLFLWYKSKIWYTIVALQISCCSLLARGRELPERERERDSDSDGFLVPGFKPSERGGWGEGIVTNTKRSTHVHILNIYRHVILKVWSRYVQSVTDMATPATNQTVHSSPSVHGFLLL